MVEKLKRQNRRKTRKKDERKEGYFNIDKPE